MLQSIKYANYKRDDSYGRPGTEIQPKNYVSEEQPRMIKREAITEDIIKENFLKRDGKEESNLR